MSRFFHRVAQGHPSLEMLVAAAFGAVVAMGLAPAAIAAAEGGPLPAKKLALTTSDGVSLAAWYYPAGEGTSPKATVIVVHDLEGSHESVEPLSKSLQQSGYAVVAPDLRGHGASTSRIGPAGRGGELDAASLRKADLLAIAASAGGRIRDHATARGDLEAVYGWIKDQSESLDANRLCIVGSGAGGTLTMLWTIADAAWPPTTKGPQGGHVRAIAMISPEWMVKGGISITPAIKANPIGRTLPIMLISGSSDKDARKITDQLKSMRPKQWIVQGPGEKREIADGLEKTSDASVFCIHAASPLSADKLAGDTESRIPTMVTAFLDLAMGDAR
ncbi:MAG: alpha/beta hydrolase [Planctomycetia bacterium]